MTVSRHGAAAAANAAAKRALLLARLRAVEEQRRRGMRTAPRSRDIRDLAVPEPKKREH